MRPRGGRGGGGRGGYGRGDDRPGGARDDRGMRDRRPDDRGVRDCRPEDRGVRDRRLDNVGMHDRRSDDMGMRDRRPDYRSPRRSPSLDRRPHLSPRRSPSPGIRPRRNPSPDRRLRRSPSADQHLRRSLSPDHRARRPRDYDSDRDVSPRRQGDYGRVPYRQERDRYDHPAPHDRVPSGRLSGRFKSPPDYMLSEHPSNLGRATEKESSFYGGPAGQSMDKDSQFYGNPGMALRVSSTGTGRTSSLYLDRRSPPMPPPPAVISPPPTPFYPSVPLTETGFLIGGTSANFAVGSTRLWHGDSKFQYRDTDHLRGSYGSRENERPDLGRDVLIERDTENDKLYHSRSMLDSEIAPSTQLKGYFGSSSSVLTEDRPYRVHGEGYGSSNGYIMDGPGRSPHDSLGHGGGRASRLPDSSLEHDNGRDDKLLPEITRQTHSKHPPRTASMEYDAGGYSRRGPENESYLGNFHGNDSRERASTRHSLGSSPSTRLEDERSNHQVRLSHRMAVDKDSMEYNVQHSYDRNTPTRYQKAKDAHVRYSRSPENHPLEFARYPEDGRELSDQIVSPMAYRRASRGASYSDYEMDMYQGDGPTGREYYNDDIDAYDLSPERMSRSSDDNDGYDARYGRPTSRNVFSRIALPNTTNEEWTDADQGNHFCPNMLAHGRSEHKPISQRLSRPMVQPQFGGSTMLGRGKGGWNKSKEKRLRAGLPLIHDGHTSDRNEFVVRPNKISKMSEDNHEISESNHDNAPDRDPSEGSEGSEEFNKQVRQAFFKFSKIINQSLAMQKRYREAKGSLSCCVCGSVSRKFPDIGALISHAYDTRKAGFRTKHLGFHKALCVMMGWSWHVPPDTSKAYLSVPAEEVNDMKKDLMLWPPVVVIRNSSVTSKAKSTEAKIVSKEEIEGVLADIGVTFDKAKISHGTPANQSVFIVKFQPTISGFQEAMRVDGHFSAGNHGKEEFLQIKGKNDKLDEALYVHIAVAEDLGYLDDETRKRCLIMSKKEIEAKADATLNLDT